MMKIKLIVLASLVLLTGIMIIWHSGCGGGSSNTTIGGSSTPAPTVTTKPASNILLNSATMNGTVNPNGVNSQAYFQWGKTTYTSATSYQPANGSNDLDISADLTGLLCESTYNYRFAVRNTSGTYYGSKVYVTTETPSSAPAQVSVYAPASGTIDVPLNVVLSWTSVSDASSYDVYFGDSTSPDKVATGTILSTYTPGTLGTNTVYYWRIDSNNSQGTTAGVLWNFQTLPVGQAGSPNPPDNAQSVSLNPQLSWSAGIGADSYDVYLGATNPPPYVTNVAITSYSSATLALATSYYWRIDSRSSTATSTGNTWVFSTTSLNFSNPGGGNWGSGYYRPITITNSGSTLTDYQVGITMTAAAFGNPYSNINANGSDIRFASSDKITEINYWIQTWSNSGNSIVWVKVPSIPNGTSLIYLYYGNSLATSSATGANTFDFYSDCGSLSGWTASGSTVDVSNGNPAPSIQSTGSQYAWRDIGLAPNTIL
jgi:hypothetical protein